MQKLEFIRMLSEQMDCTQIDAEKRMNQFLEALKKVLLAGDEITLPGFGKFSIAQKSERTGRHPQTGKVLKIPAKVVPTFKPAEAFKLQVQNAVKSSN